MNKSKIIVLSLLIVLAIILVAGSVTALDKTQNETIEMDGVKFLAPKTENYTITDVKGVNGYKTYTYSDEKNDLTVYVSDGPMPEYELGPERYDEYIGLYNYVVIKDKYVVVGSKFSENKDFVLQSLYDLNPAQ